MNKNTKPAIITATLGAGSTTSPFFIDVNITQTLCRPTCKDETPIFKPTFSLVGTSQIATNQYIATIKVEGVITYVPCGCGSCMTRTQSISQMFTIPFKVSSAPESVTITQGTTINSIVPVSCANCSKTFVSETALNLTLA